MACLPEPDDRLKSQVILWARSGLRRYAWRRSGNPFHVLSAEVFLQRTRAEQAHLVYVDFVEQVNSPEDVLLAGRKQVDAWFSKLGLCWRADHYWRLCRELVTDYGGEVPQDYESIIALPGVGQYAAGSTMTYAFGVPTGVVDSNILRIYGRYYGWQFTDSDRRRRAVLNWAQAQLPDDPDDARVYSLGLLDLGATVCLSRTPRCQRCPLEQTCSSAMSG